MPPGKASPPAPLMPAQAEAPQEALVGRTFGHTGRILPATPGDHAALSHSFISNLGQLGMRGGLAGQGVEAEGGAATITPYVSPPFREGSQDSQTELVAAYQAVAGGGAALSMALVGKSFRETEGGPSTSIDEGVEADMESECGSLAGVAPRGGPCLLQNIKSASQQSSEASQGTDSPLGSVTSTGSTFESFESQLEPDLAASLSSCSHASLTARPVLQGAATARALQPQTQLDPAADAPERAHTRSPVNFREGRRASDGLVTQGVIAFRQRLLETEKARGLTELHSVQQEHQALTSLYQAAAVTCGEEVITRTPPPPLQQAQYYRQWRHSYAGSDELSRAPLVRQRVSLPDTLGLAQQKLLHVKDPAKEADISLSKPLQQQLFQHRLQQKRQILQKQAAYPRQSFPVGCDLSRRQMVRQASYKLAQQQPVLPPLPSELSAAHLLAGLTQADLTCPPIAEHEDLGPQDEESWEGGPAWRHLTSWAPDATWHTLPTTFAACQISEAQQPTQPAQQPAQPAQTVDARAWPPLQSWPATAWHQVSHAPPDLPQQLCATLLLHLAHCCALPLSCAPLPAALTPPPPQAGAVGAAPWQPVSGGPGALLPQTVCESPILEMPEHMET